MAKRKKQKVEQPSQPAAGGAGQQPATLGEATQPVVGTPAATLERVKREREEVTSDTA